MNETERETAGTNPPLTPPLWSGQTDERRDG